MKIRNGFVSNSSSSSYVIAYSTPEKCPHCGRSDADVMELFDRINDDYGDTYISVEGYDKVLEELSSWLDEDEVTAIKKKMKKLNNGENNFAIVNVSYHNEMLAEMITNNKSVKILYSTE